MIYLPGQADVPCAECGTVFNRRGSSGVGHRKWCGPECQKTGRRRQAREKAGHQERRADNHLCPRCRTNPRPRRPDGRLRGWCKPCESKQKGEYLKTEAGKATLRRFSERHGYYSTEPEGRCEWCGETISRRGYHGAGARRFCNPRCRKDNKNYLKFLERNRKRT